MGPAFVEIDYRETALGPLSLRRRRVAALDDLEIYEVKLGDDFLMSSLFHTVEVALADLGLGATDAPELDVVVGGLGLGYTARAALRDPRVISLIVIDALAEVIGWHESGAVPLGPELTADPRCRFVHADFFAAVRADALDPRMPGRRFHAILLDIDHTPRNLLSPAHSVFYELTGLRQLADRLLPGGVFAMWADHLPDAAFLDDLRSVLPDAIAHTVTFPNPLLDHDSASTVYVARAAAAEPDQGRTT